MVCHKTISPFFNCEKDGVQLFKFNEMTLQKKFFVSEKKI